MHYSFYPSKSLGPGSMCSPQLFDFNIEVKPILEVLVGKTIEQSLLEVMEEEELANLRSQQRAFQELRNAELVEQQRLEEQERRHREEERRMKQQEVLRKEKETTDKIAARAFAQSYLADLVPSVFATLSENGYFFDPVERGQSPHALASIFLFLKSSLLFQMWRKDSCHGSWTKWRNRFPSTSPVAPCWIPSSRRWWLIAANALRS